LQNLFAKMNGLSLSPIPNSYCGTRVVSVVLNDTELSEIAAANGSMREVMNRVRRLARRKQSASTP
jgi:hypothetical protein